jgi:hypothetical protein
LSQLPQQGRDERQQDTPAAKPTRRRQHNRQHARTERNSDGTRTGTATVNPSTTQQLVTATSRRAATTEQSSHHANVPRPAAQTGKRTADTHTVPLKRPKPLRPTRRRQHNRQRARTEQNSDGTRTGTATVNPSTTQQLVTATSRRAATTEQSSHHANVPRPAAQTGKRTADTHTVPLKRPKPLRPTRRRQNNRQRARTEQNSDGTRTGTATVNPSTTQQLVTATSRRAATTEQSSHHANVPRPAAQTGKRTADTHTVPLKRPKPLRPTRRRQHNRQRARTERNSDGTRTGTATVNPSTTQQLVTATSRRAATTEQSSHHANVPRPAAQTGKRTADTHTVPLKRPKPLRPTTTGDSNEQTRGDDRTVVSPRQRTTTCSADRKENSGHTHGAAQTRDSCCARDASHCDRLGDDSTTGSMLAQNGILTAHALVLRQ